MPSTCWSSFIVLLTGLKDMGFAAACLLDMPSAVCLQVYSPLELLLFIAGCCTIADSFVPQLMNVPKATVTQVVRAVLSMSFVVGASVVVFNLKSRFCKEQAWNVSEAWAVGRVSRLGQLVAPKASAAGRVKALVGGEGKPADS